MAEGFQKLNQVVCLSVTYATNGYVSVQTGLGDSVRDNLVLREGGEETRPILPGSTIKGVIRSLVESILAQALGDDQICVPFPCSPQKNKKHERIKGRKVPCDTSENTGTCPVCQLFGNTKQRSRVTFHDAKPISKAEELSTFTRRHVAIDRETGTRFGSALMSVEAVPGNGLRFEGLVTFINPDDWMVGAVFETLHLIPYNGVGARKSRGYGDLSVAEIGLPQFIVGAPSEKQSKQDYLKNCLQKWREKREKIDINLGIDPEHLEHLMIGKEESSCASHP